MPIIRPAALAIVAAALAMPALAQESTTVSVRDAEGTLVTELTLSDAGNGVLITGSVTGISPGAHGFHFHEVGECTPPFESAGGHFNPADHQHGILSDKGHHAGDLPNIVMPEQGDGNIQVFAAHVTLAAGAGNSLRDDDGTAIVIHAGPDDYRTDPAGDSGDRIACGVVE